MTNLIIAIIVGWIMFSAVLVWFAFANSSRINRQQISYEIDKWIAGDADRRLGLK